MPARFLMQLRTQIHRERFGCEGIVRESVAGTVRFAGLDFFQRSSQQIFARNQRVDHSVFERLFGSESFSSEDDVERFRQGDQARQARRATPRWNKANL